VSLEVQAIESIEASEALEPDWQDLWRRDRAATPFQNPAWLLPWTRHVWGGGKLRVLTVRNGGKLVGLAPLFVWGFGSRPGIGRVSLLGDGVTDHLGMLADPAFELPSARIVLEWLAGDSDEWHACALKELRPGSPLLRAGAPRGLVAFDVPSGVCPVLSLPRSMDELLSRLGTKFRKNLRQAETRLQRAGAVFFSAAPDQVPEVMRALFRLHTARWTEREQTGVLGGDRIQGFHLEAAQGLAARGLLRLHALRIGGEIIAAQYNLMRDGRLYYYLSGFDPAHARRSPGTALLAWTIRSAIHEGAEEVDFLRNREAYKYQWGARDRVNRKLLLSSSAAYASDAA
jgi:CelD/BcsL family acetyltransferase involved in cellulose biosynthesis